RSRIRLSDGSIHLTWQLTLNASAFKEERTVGTVEECGGWEDMTAILEERFHS
ncbi:hypothetical protein KUCAC02_020428, partial [Chaenocephalus aceratus]